MTSLPLDLTADQIRLLTDRVKNDAKDDDVVIGKPLLLKLGSAFLEMIQEAQPKAGTCALQITEREAWLLRALINSGDRTDKEPKLGILLLRKVYAILLAFDTAIDQFADAAGDRTFREAEADALFPTGDSGAIAGPV